MPRPRSLTSTQVANAALDIVERSGAEALTMTTLAQELGIATMSLYRYVDSREHLETLMLDQILADLDCTPSQDEPWTKQTLTLLIRLHEAILAHPRAIPLVLARRGASSHGLRWGEALLAVLTTAGLADEPLVLAFRALISYLIGAIEVENLGPLSGAGTAEIAALDPEQFPHLVATAQRAPALSATDEFIRGANALIAGLVPQELPGPDLNTSANDSGPN